jgi:Flp pilus assembly protein TadG
MRKVATLISRLSGRIGLTRFARAEKGATAVEFSLVALPFFGLMFAILEIGLTMFASATLETATQMSARMIRTGIAQEQNLDSSAFKQTICDRVGVLFDCGKIKIDVRTITTFDSTIPPVLDEDGKLNEETFLYVPGKGGDIVLVRSFYEWPSLGKLVYLSLQNTGNGTFLMNSTAVFKNEPFPW